MNWRKHQRNIKCIWAESDVFQYCHFWYSLFPKFIFEVASIISQENRRVLWCQVLLSYAPLLLRMPGTALQRYSKCMWAPLFANWTLDVQPITWKRKAHVSLNCEWVEKHFCESKHPSRTFIWQLIFKKKNIYGHWRTYA